MKQSRLKRVISLLLALACIVSISAGTIAEAAAIEAESGADAENDAFDVKDITFEEEGEGEPSKDAASDGAISYVDIDGNYLAPETLTVYITRTMDGEKVSEPVAEEKFTGVVAFYDYNQDRARETPYFFYYEKGVLQQDTPVMVAAEGYLDLVNPPVSASVMEPDVALAAEDAPEEKVYAAEEVYVDADAAEHESYLFAFNQENGDNGLYTGEYEGQSYQKGIMPAAETENDPTGGSAEEEQPAEDVVRSIPATTIAQKAGGVQVSWTKDSTATGYRVLRREANSTQWTTVADLEGGDQSSYLDESAVSNTTYIYAVRSYFGTNSGADREDVSSNLWGGYQESSSINYLAAPKLTAVYDSNDGLVLKWNSVAGADNYYIYRCTPDSKQWVWQAQTTGLTYTDTKAEVGGTYLYTVMPVRNGVKGPYYDYKNDDTQFVTRHAAPTVIVANAANATETGIQVKWTQDAAATGYRVYRKSKTNSNWEPIANITKGSTTTYADFSVSNSSTYAYAVRAYYGTDPIANHFDYESGAWSTYQSSAWLTYLAAPAVQRWSDNSGMKISWTAVPTATSYRVYRKTDSTNWVTLKTTDANTTSYVDTTAVADTEYYYVVRALGSTSYSGYFMPEKPAAYHAAPAISAGNTNTNGIKLAWTKGKDVTGYRIYRKAAGENSWSILGNLTAAELTGSTCTWTDSNVKNGTSYYYTVCAYYGTDAIQNNFAYTSNDWSGYKSISILCISCPVITQAISDTTGVAVSWEAVPGATSYHVYHKTASGNWIWLGQTKGESNTKFIDTQVVNGTEYYYTVRAQVNTGGTSALSAYVPLTTGCVYHAPPQLSYASTSTGLFVTWTNDPLATGYRVFRRTAATSWSTVANLLAGSTSYKDTALSSGDCYYYAVRAYYGEEAISTVGNYGGNLWSGFVPKGFTYLSTPTLPANGLSNEPTGIKVTWEKVTGANGYKVYRKDLSAATPSWKQIASVNGQTVTSYIDGSGLKTNTQYVYTVRAVAKDGTLSSYYSDGVLAVYLPAPKNFAVDAPTSSGTSITWSSVPGATHYRVCRKTASSSWQKIGEVNGTSYVDTAVKDRKTTYYYTVVAISNQTYNGKTYAIYGDYNRSGVTFAIKWSGSERNQWVFKNNNYYYVDSNGYLYTGWKYANRNGGRYKYFFNEETGALCTNLFNLSDGIQYRDMKMKYITYINSSSSNPSYLTVYLYTADYAENKGSNDGYCMPAVSVRCIGSMEFTQATNSGYIRSGSAQRWLHNPELEGATYEQYATYIRGTTSWFHSALYKTQNYKNFMSYTYNSLRNNSNNSLGCIRLQGIYAYLLCDIQLNGYGSSHRVPVIIYRNKSNKGPFNVPKMDSIKSRKTDPTDPAVTGKFFYKTSIFGVSAKAGASNWTYY